MAEPAGGRPWSLRSRVALAAALGAVIVAVAAGVVVAALLSHREVAALDRRLDAVATVAQNRLSTGAGLAELLGSGRRGLLRATVDGLVVTVRSDAGKDDRTDTLTLVKVGNAWKISELGSATSPAS